MSDAISPLNDALRGRYTIVREVGAGGMATVYLATDERHGRKVAIKVLRPELADAIGAARFLSEIRTTANLQHPHILTLHDSGEADGQVYFVTPFVAGETLRERLDARGRLEIDEVVRVAASIADALQHAHEQGVVHRDVKPGNVLFQDDHPIVADFGIAFAPDVGQDTRLTRAGISLGTPHYMSPEQAMGEADVDPRSDVFSLGCVTYEMLTGEPPFQASTDVALLAKILTQDPASIRAQRDDVPEGVEQVVMAALAKQPGDRVSTAKDFGRALREAWMPHADTARITTPRAPASRAPRSPRRSRWGLGFAAAAVVATAAWWVGFGGPMDQGALELATDAPVPMVLIGGVENRTEDETYDALLPELLATTLEQSNAIQVYPRSNVPNVLQRMRLAPGVAIDEEVGLEIVEREGLSAVALQSITELGSSLVLVVSIVLPDGRTMVSTQETLADEGELPERMDAVGASLREAFGESAEDLARTNVPLAEVTSRSLDAVRFFSQGRQTLHGGDPRGAIVLLERAVELDPEFASAQGALGAAYTNIQDMVRAAEHLEIAAGLADRAPAAERDKILGDYAMTLRDHDTACAHYQVLVAARSSANLMLGYCSALRLDFETAVRATERAGEIAPSVRADVNLAWVSFLAGDLDRAGTLASSIREQIPGLMQIWFVEGKVLMANGAFDDAETLYRDMVDLRGDMEVEGHHGLADLSRARGRLEESLQHLDAARAAALARGNAASTASATIQLAERALELGQREAYEAALRGLAPPSDPWLLYHLGRTRARGGDIEQARDAERNIADVSATVSPQHQALEALLRAEVALTEQRPGEAVTEAEAAVRYEASTVAHETLGRSYLADGRPVDAAPHFREVVQRRHERCASYDAPSCYASVDGLYWLGRALDEAGDAAGAEGPLRQFLERWEGAPAHPWVRDAEERLSRG